MSTLASEDLERRLKGIVERVLGTSPSSILKNACSSLISLVEVSSPEGALLVYMFGLRLGERIGTETRSSASYEDPWKSLELLIQILDLAKGVKMVKEGSNKVLLEIERPVEAMKFKGQLKGPSCNFLRGLVAGFLSELMGEPIFVNEKGCCHPNEGKCGLEVRFMPEFTEELSTGTRRLIVEYLRVNPGAHLRQMSRDLGMSLGSLRWHLSVLERNGLVWERKKGNQTTFYLSKVEPT